MPDTDLTAGDALAGTPAPSAEGPACLPCQSPTQPQASTPQQAVATKHRDVDKVTSFIFGQQRDARHNAVREKPGHIFRALLAGALLGGAQGATLRARPSRRAALL